MSKAVRFTQADIVRVVAAAKAAGLPVAGVEVTRDGSIRTLPVGASSAEPELSAYDAWDREHGRDAA